MKALLSGKIDDRFSLNLQTTDEPTIEDDEVLIKVIACGINYPDTLIIKDQYQIRPKRPFAPGGEVFGGTASFRFFAVSAMGTAAVDSSDSSNPLELPYPETEMC